MNGKSKLSAAVLALVAAGAAGTLGEHYAGDIARQFLAEVEGVRYTAYLDSSGIPTICMGHTAGVKMGMVATPRQCQQWADEDIAEAERIVDMLVDMPMSEPRKASVISFCAYNLGPTKCSTSTFLKKLNRGDDKGVCAEVRRWIYDRGRDCRIQANNCFGQVKRREQEEELCNL